ncbi:MAG: class I SAM-dependent methyltransferase [Myxococcales bacterium]|nr:class I SAM-dependent methyltransferase [Myxococcales bacterium]
MDAIAKMKDAARAGWSTFAPFEMTTCLVAPKLVSFAGVGPGSRVLDAGCGTGVVAVTAARLGAAVKGLDLTPELLERARENAKIAGVDIAFQEGDVEALPYPDASFDFVLSQFGHMFGPRPDVTTAELLRVLVPGGTIAFSTWPPDVFTGRMFALLARYAPPPPEGASPPGLWGDPKLVAERLGDRVRDLVFDRERLRLPGLSPNHVQLFLEVNVGPIQGLIAHLSSTPQELTNFRAEMLALIELYFDENHLRQDFLMTRAVKV